MKFYTEDGIWDLVGNNTPIFFIRDPLLFPVFIHTQKRNPATHLKVTADIARVYIFTGSYRIFFKKNPPLQFSFPNFGHRQDISDDLKELIMLHFSSSQCAVLLKVKLFSIF